MNKQNTFHWLSAYFPSSSLVLCPHIKAKGAEKGTVKINHFKAKKKNTFMWNDSERPSVHFAWIVQIIVWPLHSAALTVHGYRDVIRLWSFCSLCQAMGEGDEEAFLQCIILCGPWRWLCVFAGLCPAMFNCTLFWWKPTVSLSFQLRNTEVEMLPRVGLASFNI